MGNLYHIRREHLDLLAVIEDGDGEVTAELEVALFQNEIALKDEAISVAYLIKSLEDRGELIANEIKRLQDLKKRAGKWEELFKKRLSEAMNQYGIERIDGEFLKISFRSATAVEVNNERLVPPEYWVTLQPEISKTLIKDALKAAKDVPGATLVTRRHIQIK